MNFLKSSIIFVLYLFNLCSPSFSQQDYMDGKIVPLELLASTINSKHNDSIFYVKNGTYSNQKLNISYNGTRKLIIKAESPGNVILDGKTLISISDSKNIVFKNFFFKEIINENSIVINNSSFILIENNYFFKCGFRKSHSILLVENGSFSNQIKRNTFDGSKAMSVVISGRHKNLKDKENRDNEISYNFFYNIPRVTQVYPGQNNGLEAIQIGQGTSDSFLWELNTKVHHNLFENIIGDAAEIISIKSSSNEIYKNTFLNNLSGITIRFGNNNIIRENYLENTTRGIRAFGDNQIISKNIIINPTVGIQLPSANFSKFEMSYKGGYYQATNSIIEDNYIEGAEKNSILIGFGDLPYLPKKITIKKNLIYRNKNQNSLSIHNDVKRRTIRKKKTNKILTNTEYSKSLISPNYKFNSIDDRVGVDWKRPNK